MKFRFTKKQIPTYISSLVLIIFAILYFFNIRYSSNNFYNTCNVRNIDIYGEIYTYIPDQISDKENSVHEGIVYNYGIVSSEDVLHTIKDANEDPKTKAILINVDSPGGSPVAGEEILLAIKNSKKPVIALVRGMASSSAYWAISSADKILHHEIQMWGA